MGQLLHQQAVTGHKTLPHRAPTPHSGGAGQGGAASQPNLCLFPRGAVSIPAERLADPTVGPRLLLPRSPALCLLMENHWHGVFA